MKKTVLLLLACSVMTTMEAQKFKNDPLLAARPAGKKVTFWDVQKAFESFWKDKEASREEAENAEEGGWQQFRRWEWFMKQRTYPKGEFPNPEILFNEYRLYKNQHTQKSGQSVTAANWSFMGPAVVPANGGGAGRLNCMEFDPANTNIIWAGAACGGLWKSTNGGSTWSSNTDLLPSLSISEIVINPSNTQIMYLATGDKYGVFSGYETWGHYSAGVLKSTDGGVTWNATGLSYSLANVTLIQRLIIDPSNTNVLYAATNAGIFKTTNAGASWTSLLAGSFFDIELHPTNSSILYAGDATGVLRTTNAGAAWSYVSGVTSLGRTSLAVTPASAASVYVWSEGGGFYYSSNAGVSFTARTDPDPTCTAYGYYDMVLEVSPSNLNVVSVGGLKTAISTNGGSTWTVVSNWSSHTAANYSHADNHALKFLPGSSTTLFSCNDGGLFKTTNQGSNWSDLSTGINIKQYYRMGGSYLTSTLMYAGAQDNGTDKITGMNTSEQVYGGDGEDCLVDYTNDNIVFVNRLTEGKHFTPMARAAATGPRRSRWIQRTTTSCIQAAATSGNRPITEITGQRWAALLTAAAFTHLRSAARSRILFTRPPFRIFTGAPTEAPAGRR
jgi:photosystem II stability/assembly factor-like uncharacterized protein